MNEAWSDFNNADAQTSFEVIPKGTIAPVRMIIKPGGYDDQVQGWTGGYATSNPSTGSVYLNCEFVIVEGPHVRRKVWSLIGLFSSKGPEWGNMGRSFIRGILNSARGLSDKDNSPQAQAARRISGFADLDGIAFLAKIDVGKDLHDNPKNEIRFAVTPNHKDWQAYQDGGGTWKPGGAPVNTAPAGAQSVNAAAPEAGAQQTTGTNRPAWAQ